MSAGATTGSRRLAGPSRRPKRAASPSWFGWHGLPALHRAGRERCASIACCCDSIRPRSATIRRRNAGAVRAAAPGRERARGRRSLGQHDRRPARQRGRRARRHPQTGPRLHRPGAHALARIRLHRRRPRRTWYWRHDGSLLGERLRAFPASALPSAGPPGQTVADHARLQPDGAVGAQFPRLDGRRDVVRVDRLLSRRKGHRPARRGAANPPGHDRQRRRASHARRERRCSAARSPERTIVPALRRRSS